jgi:hypothetical protein
MFDVNKVYRNVINLQIRTLLLGTQLLRNAETLWVELHFPQRMRMTRLYIVIFPCSRRGRLLIDLGGIS